MARRKRMPERPPETRGERIKRYRIAAGLSQPALAAQLHISLATVSRWETAGRMPQQSHREPLALALGVSWTVLEHGEGVDIGLRSHAAPSVSQDRRRPLLAPLRAAVEHVQRLGDEALADFVDAVVELGERGGWGSTARSPRAGPKDRR